VAVRVFTKRSQLARPVGWRFAFLRNEANWRGRLGGGSRFLRNEANWPGRLGGGSRFYETKPIGPAGWRWFAFLRNEANWPGRLEVVRVFSEEANLGLEIGPAIYRVLCSIQLSNWRWALGVR
jgi:hypothetical protein